MSNCSANNLKASVAAIASLWLFFMIPLPEYAKIKDNYCIAYYGNCKDFLIQLKVLRPFMESKFPGVKVFISCKDEFTYLFSNEPRIITKTELKDNRKQFGYIRELVCDMKSHPIEDFMNESEIPCGPVEVVNKPDSNKCVILTNGVLPTKTLTAEQIKKAIKYAENKGFIPEINTSIDGAKYVIGVENEQLYEAAVKGSQVCLISTGLGENLFKKMFPDNEITKF